MAVIGAIQKNIWIVMVLIGIALVAFLLMDVTGQSSGRTAPQTVEFASIDGREIRPQDYNLEVNRSQIEYLVNQGQLAAAQQGQFQMDPATVHELNEQAWNDLVNRKIMEEHLERSNMTLSEPEFANLIYGTDPHPLIASFGPVMQQLAGLDISTPGATNQFIQTISSQQAQQSDPRIYELYQNFLLREQTVRQEALEAKYSDFMKGSAYVPKWLALREDQMQNTRLNLDYLILRYQEVDDTEVGELSEVDISRKYNEMKPTFSEQDESRNIEYVAFDVIPTSEDTAATVARLESLKQTWMGEDDDTTYARRYSEDVTTAWTGAWYNNTLLSTIVSDSAAAADIELLGPGGYTGIFFDGGYYRTAKVVEENNWHDSIQVRHIFFQNPVSPDGTVSDEDAAALQARADSVYALLTSGTQSFEELLPNSDDVNTKTVGGEIGWVDPNTPLFPRFKQYVFEDGVPGEPQLIQTLGGYHILDVVERRNPQDFYRVAMLSIEMEPSQETDARAGDAAQSFLDKYGRNFDEGVSEMGYQVRISGAFAESQYNVLGLQGSRSVVDWAYRDDMEVGEVDMFNLPDKYIVARLREKRQKGKPELETVRAQVEAELVKEKKAEILLERMNAAMTGASDLQAVATALGSEVQSAQNANFAGNFIPQVGAEPEVLGIAFGLEPGAMSTPVVGNQGVFVVVPTEQIPSDASQDAEDLSNRLRATLTNRYNRLQILNAIKKEAEIVDNHRQFN